MKGGGLVPGDAAGRMDAQGTEALNPNCLVLRAVRELKKALPDLLVITDVALDPYTTHGHDGVLNAEGTDVDNDATVAILAKMAVCQAEAGVRGQPRSRGLGAVYKRQN